MNRAIKAVPTATRCPLRFGLLITLVVLAGACLPTVAAEETRTNGHDQCPMAKEGEDRQKGELPYYLEQLPLNRQLRIVAEVGCTSRAKEILQKGAKVDAVFGGAPILLDALRGTNWGRGGRPGIVRLLLSHGADPNRQVDATRRYHNPLFLSLTDYKLARDDEEKKRLKQIITLLLDFGARLPGNAARDEYEDALSLAGSHCDVELVGRLLETGMDFSLEGHDGPSILVGCGSPEMVRYMLDHGGVITPDAVEWVLSDVNAPWKAEIAHWLLDANINPAGYEFVSHALAWEDNRLLKRALGRGSSPDRFVGMNVNFPLGLAAGKGNQEAVRILLDHGADVSNKWYEKTAVELARERGHEKIARLIEEHSE